MPRYRKKPVVIEAMRNIPEDFNLIRLWMGNKIPIHQLGDGKLGITTLEGVMTAGVGDWIIRGVNGELYPIKDEIFRETYDEVMNA